MSYTELEAGYKGLIGSNFPQYFSACNTLPQYARPRIPMAEADDEGVDECFDDKQVLVGICAMAKKSESKPMKEILNRLDEFEYIKTAVFREESVLKLPVEEWPLCDCLISFHSKGFPLDKAIHYSNLKKPYIINNIDMQYELQDRRKVYSILKNEGILIPRYAVLDRDSPDPKMHELIESEDHVEVNGVCFNKPFVEKPVSAEDHNIYIYYPTAAGGGSQRLFRKIGSRSSVYSPESRVRKTGSYIYEDFMPTDGTDVKVYTVGPDYAHAEARKSPALDGKVERDSEGKEVRYPVILSGAEKLIARKVCLAFKQTVCGFDLLRANGKSYVCDVNGFSFVKNSNKYYDDCARILGNMILRELAPTLHIPWAIPFQLDDPPIVPTTFGKMMELRCVVGIIRHGDRTPKQKMKMEVRHNKFFELFEKYGGSPDNNVKLKRPKQLQEVLDIARFLLSEGSNAKDPEIEEKRGKLDQLKSVLEMYGYFSGINRKVQLKYQPKGRPRASSSEDDTPKEPSLVLILKWGGELTPAGRVQAEELGRIFRCEYAGTQGLGLLRLHSTYRHDLKIYASDEGRVQMTAAAFAKGLLALEGELTPILVQMVKSAHTNGLLDNDCESSKFQRQVKQRLHESMQVDKDLTPEDIEKINPCGSSSVNKALAFIKNPFKCCEKVLEMIHKLVALIQAKRDDPKTKDAALYHGESWDLMARRWGKLEKDFQAKGNFDISKIPDIYDCIKYDIQHNSHGLAFDQAEELYMYAKNLADVVIPQEYGLTQLDKLAIAQGICAPLLRKIRTDLQRNIGEPADESVNRLDPRYSHGVSSPGRHVRTRLYFTSESHIHSLLTMIRFGGIVDKNVTQNQDEQWNRAMEYVSAVSELNYLTQIVIMLYEDPTKDLFSEERFHVELHFSPGVNCCVQKNLLPGPGFRPNSRSDSIKSQNASSSADVEKLSPPKCTVSDEVISTKGSDNEEPAKSSSSTQPIPIRGSPGRRDSRSYHGHSSSLKEHDDYIALTDNEDSSPVNCWGSHERRNEIETNNDAGATSITSRGNSACARSLLQRSASSSYPELAVARNTNVNVASGTFTDSVGTAKSDLYQDAFNRRRAGFVRLIRWYTQGGGTSLFSTAVITGHTRSDINAKSNLDVERLPLIGMGIPGLDSAGRFPSIRSLETLHNALSLRQLDAFLERIVSVNYRPASSLTPATTIPPPDVLSTASEDEIRSTPPLEAFASKPPTNFSPSSSLGWSGPPSYVSSGQTSPLNPQIPDLPKTHNSNTVSSATCGIDNANTTTRKEVNKCPSFESD
ncbi:unnamed protein product [Allacma fusca]|uniref:Inositol hexakisphosphate and diphosphoinositol-pentakisphosphate kinase n=1 Tax=Allacma fusca TaxID=39272 RepID=A0A8J2PJA2_9HEXA|nr:unnamed protein product [Allacma fusca]